MVAARLVTPTGKKGEAVPQADGLLPTFGTSAVMTFGPVSATTVVLGRTRRSAATGRRTAAAEVTRRVRRGSTEVLGGRTDVRGSATEVASWARRGSIEMLGGLAEVLRGRTVRGSATEIAGARGAAAVRRPVVRELGTATARATWRRGTAMGNRASMIFEAMVLRAVIHGRRVMRDRAGAARARATHGTTMRTTGATRSHYTMT